MFWVVCVEKCCRAMEALLVCRSLHVQRANVVCPSAQNRFGGLLVLVGLKGNVSTEALSSRSSYAEDKPFHVYVVQIRQRVEVLWDRMKHSTSSKTALISKRLWAFTQ